MSTTPPPPQPLPADCCMLRALRTLPSQKLIWVRAEILIWILQVHAVKLKQVRSFMHLKIKWLTSYASGEPSAWSPQRAMTAPSKRVGGRIPRFWGWAVSAPPGQKHFGPRTCKEERHVGTNGRGRSSSLVRTSDFCGASAIAVWFMQLKSVWKGLEIFTQFCYRDHCARVSCQQKGLGFFRRSLISGIVTHRCVKQVCWFQRWTCTFWIAVMKLLWQRFWWLLNSAIFTLVNSL